MKKVGYVALIGRPNSGKSTFLNTLIGEKISAVSPKPQTTQKSIKAIYNDNDSQIIFFDTPGLNEGKEMFFEHLKSKIIDSLEDADAIVRFIDSTRVKGEEENIIENILKKINKPIVSIYSKYDEHINEYNKIEGLKLSSYENSGLDELISKIKENLNIGELLYDEDYYTDQDYETRISEIIKEKIFLNFHDEVPYSTFVEVGEIDDTPKLLKIQAYIYTESDSQKKIIIGKKGQELTKIGQESRLELEDIYGRKVFLALRVKVMPKWKKNKKLLNKLY